MSVFPFSDVIVTVAVPAFKAFIFPLSTEITEESEDFHVIVLDVALLGLTELCKIYFCPIPIVTADSSSNETLFTSIGLTIILQVSLTFSAPSVTVIVLSPSLTAFTFPFLSTVAILVFDEVQIRFLASSFGLTVTSNFSESPNNISTSSSSKVISSTFDTQVITSSLLLISLYAA